MRWCRYALVFFALAVSACDKRSGDAIILTKEHIPVREIVNSPAPELDPPTDDVEAKEQYRELAPDEIAVDTYVMKAVDRGTARDPRALGDEQWLVKVRAVADGREFNISAEKGQFERLKEGERVRVRYRVGKYTKTVWAASFE